MIVDDHQDIRDPLAEFLHRHGFKTMCAADGKAMDQLLHTGLPDIIVLDVMMPGENGLSICKRLRAAHNIPIIMLSAMGEETDRIVGLEIGADDYITKPFSPRELVARIKTVLRRANASRTTPDKTQQEDTITFGDWILVISQRELQNTDGVAIPLSTSEFNMLHAFLERPNRILSRDQLLDLTKGRAAEMFDRSIDNQVSRLRKKIESDPKNPTFIKTVWGGGYMFSLPKP
jgi:two-component system OmpR family response regulator